MLAVQSESSNNFEEKAGIIPKILLRWMITERVFESTDSWCSMDSEAYRTYRTAPKLQYSLDGIQWEDVPEVIISSEITTN